MPGASLSVSMACGVVVVVVAKDVGGGANVEPIWPSPMTNELLFAGFSFFLAVVPAAFSVETVGCSFLLACTGLWAGVMVRVGDGIRAASPPARKVREKRTREREREGGVV